MSHRGFSRDGLENTFRAFAAAVDLGYSYVETDVHATSDGGLLAFHDPLLDRVTNGSGAVGDRTVAELVDVRIGGRDPIPTFAELLVAFPAARFNVGAGDTRQQVHLKYLL